MSWLVAGYVKHLTRCPNGDALTASAKYVALLIADYYDDEKGYAWPSAAEVARVSLLSRNGVAKILRQLAESGVLTIEHQKAKNGAIAASRFRFPWIPAHPASPRDKAVSPQDTPVSPGDTATNKVIETLGETLEESTPNGVGQTPAAHPIHAIIQSELRFRPNEKARADVEARVGRDAESLAMFERCAHAWQMAGYNTRNLAGVLDWYADGGPPARSRPRANGTPPTEIRTMADLAAKRIREGAIDGPGSGGRIGARLADFHGGTRDALRELPAPRER